METKPVSYFQTDSRWRYADYSAKGESTTIGASGCGPTSMAMVLATWCDKSVTPLTECRWALAHGYKCPHSGTYYEYFVPAADRYGLTCIRLNTVSIYGNGASPHHATAKAAIDRGDLVIACMGKGTWTSSGHYVLMWRISGNTVFINDPASSKPARTAGNYAVFKQQVKYYWIIRAPKKKEDTMSNLEIQDLIASTVKTQIEKAVPEIVNQVLDQLPKPVIYDTLDEVPAWGRAAVEKRLPNLQGTGKGLGLSLDLLRVWVVQDREEEKRKALNYGMD